MNKAKLANQTLDSLIKEFKNSPDQFALVNFISSLGSWDCSSSTNLNDIAYLQPDVDLNIVNTEKMLKVIIIYSYMFDSLTIKVYDHIRPNSICIKLPTFFHELNSSYRKYRKLYKLILSFKENRYLIDYEKAMYKTIPSLLEKDLLKR